MDYNWVGLLILFTIWTNGIFKAVYDKTMYKTIIKILIKTDFIVDDLQNEEQIENFKNLLKESVEQFKFIEKIAFELCYTKNSSENIMIEALLTLKK